MCSLGQQQIAMDANWNLRTHTELLSWAASSLASLTVLLKIFQSPWCWKPRALSLVALKHQLSLEGLFHTVLQGITSAIKWVYRSIACIKRFQIAGWRGLEPCQTHCVQTRGVQSAGDSEQGIWYAHPMLHLPGKTTTTHHNSHPWRRSCRIHLHITYTTKPSGNVGRFNGTFNTSWCFVSPGRWLLLTFCLTSMQQLIWNNHATSNNNEEHKFFTEGFSKIPNSQEAHLLK